MKISSIKTTTLYLLIGICTSSGTAAELTMQAGPAMAHPRMGHYAVSLPDGRVALIGGHTSNFVSLNSIEVLSADGSSLQDLTLPSPFDMGAAVQLSDGRLLVAGGAADLGVAPGYNTTAIYDPTDQSIIPGPELTYPRMMCYGTQLSGGGILIVGGWYDSTSATYGEIADSGLTSFRATGALNTPRSNPLVFPMNDGRAIILGGNYYYGTPYYEQVEVYHPTTNSFEVLRDSLLPQEPGWYVLGNQKVTPDLRLPDGRYAFLIQKQVEQQWKYAIGILDPVDGTVSKIMIADSLLGGDSVFWVLYRENTFYLLVGKNVNNQANTHFRIVRISHDGLTTDSSNTMTIDNYYLGNATPAITGNRIFVSGGTSAVNYYYNFSPVNQTFFLPAEPLATEPHYNGWLYMQFPYAYSWTMSRWIFIWGDVLITDLSNMQTGYLVP